MVRVQSTSAVTAGSHNPGAALVNQYPEPTDYAIAYGQQSLMINAAIMAGKNEPENPPRLVDIELPRIT